MTAQSESGMGPRRLLLFSMAAAAVIPRIAAQIESYADQVILGTPFDGEIDSTLNASVPLGCELEVERVWDQIAPTKELKWYMCYGGTRRCARLIVPLNYTDPDGQTATVALAKVPSEYPPESEHYRGPILFYPGGPGGSGIDLINQIGGQFSRVIGPQFDIVGFDPRGLARSTPKGVVFSPEERASWSASQHLMDDSEEHVPKAWARAQVFGKLVEKRAGAYFKHINTENIARDMLSIVRAHGREKLMYWGFSYGSVLGSTFATLFPDNIERMIVDGIVDAENYYATHWSNNLVDADKVLQLFFDTCHAAGPDVCAFHAPTPALIAQNLTNLIESVRAHPVPVVTSKSYGVFDYPRLRATLFGAQYKPYSTWGPLALALAKLAEGDADMIYSFMDVPAYRCLCASGAASVDAKALAQEERRVKSMVIPEGFSFVACNDGENLPEDLDWALAHREQIAETSVFGKLWANIPLLCSGWPRYEKKHFRGPIGAKKTSFPILLIGNTADIVTPLVFAHKMSSLFDNSVVLTQNSVGHCSITTPSLCTAQHVRNYFAHGTLPAPGTVCEADGSPWSVEDKALLERAEARVLASDEQEEQGEQASLLDAIRDLSLTFQFPPIF